MDFFPDGHHVRLQSRGRKGMYLHAGDDGVGVYLSRERASLHAAWQVHCVVRDGETYVLLHGAAYGRYLKATNDPAPSGHLGRNVVQDVYDDEDDNAVYLLPAAGPADGVDEVLRLHHIHDNRALRANGKYCKWRTGISADDYNGDTMMHWVVEAIPPRPSTPALPHPTPATASGAFWNKFLCLAAPVEVEERRTIRYVEAEDDGSFDPNGWTEIEFHGRSVFKLRLQIGEARGNIVGFKMCVQAGSLGRLTSLVIDLPPNEDPVDVVLLPDWTPTFELRDPNVDE